MPRGEYLGEFEQMVLLAIGRLDANAYGMAIRDELEERTGRDVVIGSVYSALDRLERAGLAHSEMGSPTSERGGRAKRFYTLTPDGIDALTRARRMLEALWEGLELG